MTMPKIQSLRSLREEMKVVARGERSAPADAATISFNSVAALTRLLTPENRHLLAIIRDRKPQSVAELAEMTGRAASNVTRTLSKLQAAGFVEIKTVARRKIPVTTIKKITVEIDPYTENDRLEVAI